MAANAVRGERKVEIGGRPFVLVPSFSRLAKVEAALGRSTIQFMRDAVAQNVTLVDTVTVIELLAREPKLKTEEIGACVTKEGQIRVLGLLVNAVGHVLVGEDEDDEKKDDDAEDAGASGKDDPAADVAE